MSRKTQETLTGYLFVAPWIISAVVFTFGAMLYVLYLSFTDLQLLNEPKLIGFDNYAKILKDPLFHDLTEHLHSAACQPTLTASY